MNHEIETMLRDEGIIDSSAGDRLDSLVDLTEGDDARFEDAYEEDDQ